MQGLSGSKYGEAMGHIDASTGISPTIINDFSITNGMHPEDPRYGGYYVHPHPHHPHHSSQYMTSDSRAPEEFHNPYSTISPTSPVSETAHQNTRATTSTSLANNSNTTTSRVSERRAEQNRAAQRAFRHRKNLYIKNLETKVKLFETRETEIIVLDRRCKELQGMLETLTRERDYINWERDAWKREREGVLGSFEKMRWEIGQLHVENAQLRDKLASGGAAVECKKCGEKLVGNSSGVNSGNEVVDVAEQEKCNKGSNAVEKSKSKEWNITETPSSGCPPSFDTLDVSIDYDSTFAVARAATSYPSAFNTGSHSSESLSLLQSEFLDNTSKSNLSIGVEALMDEKKVQKMKLPDIVKMENYPQFSPHEQSTVQKK
ncbi:hypothetical protein HK098_003567 [Nowakowskiella sp. JEL0407]|nr:hypothetical protein HK098_003567 [Nowakowskiella sp. JEL0407]